MSAPPAKKSAQPETGRNSSTAPTDNRAASKLQRNSWRTFYKVHPACDVFPRLSQTEQRDLANDIEANGLKVAIQTREVAGENVKYMTDGRERLDAMESKGWQIVNDKGEWIGALARVPGSVCKVEHRQGYTHENVAGEVIAFNIHHRHLNADQRAMLVAKLRVPQLRAEAKERQTAHLRKGDQIPVLPDSSKRESTRERLAEEARVTVHKAGEALRVVKNEKPHVVDDIIAGKRRIASVKTAQAATEEGAQFS